MRYSITPFEIEEKSFESVIDLYADLRRMQIRQENKEGKPIRRRASDNAGWW